MHFLETSLVLNFFSHSSIPGQVHFDIDGHFVFSLCVAQHNPLTGLRPRTGSDCRQMRPGHHGICLLHVPCLFLPLHLLRREYLSIHISVKAPFTGCGLFSIL